MRITSPQGRTEIAMTKKLTLGRKAAEKRFLSSKANGIKVIRCALLLVSTLLMPIVNVSAVEQALPVSAANTSIFGPNVYVFDPSMPAGDIEHVAMAVFKLMEANHFGQERYALLFKPGKYNINVKVGFYTHVAGLGRDPDDVQIDGALTINAKWADGLALNNFWRTIENLAIIPSANVPWQDTKGVTRIAVSQAAPLRRLHVKGELQLFDWTSKGTVGYASGGFLADSIVDGKVVPASQQQWLSRNSKWGDWSNGVWNMVFVGCENTPSGAFPDPPYTVVGQTPIIREKPYLYVDNLGKYAVFVPVLQTNTHGASWFNGSTPGTAIPLDQFYIAQPSTATAKAINAALKAGKNILFTPGVFPLDETLTVTHAHTIILGIGVPSLVPKTGHAALSVADVDDVTIAGMILDAGPVRSPCLLEVGPADSAANHSVAPTFLYDLTVRTGGPEVGKSGASVIINSGNVVVDNIWIWRADHGAGVGWNTNPTENGLIVNGNDVTIYGLFNEHHEHYQTLWNGNGGRVYMYQSEMPYDVPDQASWMNGATHGFASYKVAESVTSHEAWGLGIYCFFRDAAVKADCAIEAPMKPGVKLHHLTTVWLDGNPGSEIAHIVNDLGAPRSEVRCAEYDFRVRAIGDLRRFRNSGGLPTGRQFKGVELFI